MTSDFDVPATPVAVARHIAGLVEELYALSVALTEADKAAVRARADHDRYFSMAYLQTSGSTEFRRHTATRTTIDRRLAADEADVRVRELRRDIDNMKLRIETGRSYGAAVRAELAALPYMEG